MDSMLGFTLLRCVSWVVPRLSPYVPLVPFRTMYLPELCFSSSHRILHPRKIEKHILINFIVNQKLAGKVTLSPLCSLAYRV